MDLSTLGRGFLLGLAIAAPLGPIGMLVLRASLVRGFFAAFSAGLGAATADAVYATVAASGVALARDVTASFSARVLSAAVLVALAVSALRGGPEDADESSGGGVRSFAGTFVLTLANPATIASFAAASTALGVAAGSLARALAFSTSVFLGSAAWWLLLSSAGSRFQRHVGPRAERLIRVLSSAVLVGFAAYALFRR